MVDNKNGEENDSHGNEHELSPEMPDNKEGEETLPRGNDWEVVSLTASTYAAAPGPRGDETSPEEKDPTVSKDYEAETSRALFMSGHFVFPPSQHENLSVNPENFENSKEVNDYEPVGNINVVKEGKAEQKEEENWRIEGVNVAEEFPVIPLLEQKGDQILSIHGSRFDESTTLHKLDIDRKEKDDYGTATFSSFHGEPDLNGSEAFGESIVMSDLQPSDDGIDPLPLLSKPPGSEKDDETDDSDLPCGAWWKRRVVSLCAQVKDTSSFWSIFVAAAVMGLVILGQHWQQERWQVLQQRWHFSVGDEVLLIKLVYDVLSFFFVILDVCMIMVYVTDFRNEIEQFGRFQ